MLNDDSLAARLGRWLGRRPAPTGPRAGKRSDVRRAHTAPHASATTAAPSLPAFPGIDRRVVFFHLPKTGGTALTQQAGLFFAERSIQPWSTNLADLLPDAPRDPGWTTRRPSWGTTNLGDLRFFAREHLEYATWQRLRVAHPELSTALSFALFREPVSRASSMLSHRRRESPEAVEAALLRGAFTTAQRDAALRYSRAVQVMDAEELLAAEDPVLRQSIRDDLADRMTRAFLPVPDPTRGGLAGTALEAALEAIAGLDLIGLQEDLLGSLWKLCHALDLPMPPATLEANRGDGDVPSPRAAAMLADLNPHDRLLYEHVRDRHRRECQRLPAAADHNRRWAETRDVTAYRDGVEIPASGALPGWGWHCREAGVNGLPFLCWTGPVAVVFLPVPPDRRSRFELDVHGVMGEASWTGTLCRIDGRDFPLAPSDVATGVRRLAAELPPGTGRRRGWTEVEIVVPATRSHEDLQPGCGDRRIKGLLVEAIRLVAAR